jgi:hypothetical protein
MQAEQTAEVVLAHVYRHPQSRIIVFDPQQRGWVDELMLNLDTFFKDTFAHT